MENNFPVVILKFYVLISSIFILIPDSICWFPLWKFLASSLYLQGSDISRWCVCCDLFIHCGRHSVCPFNLEICDSQFWGTVIDNFFLSDLFLEFQKSWTSCFEPLSFLFFLIFYSLIFLFYFLGSVPYYILTFCWRYTLVIIFLIPKKSLLLLMLVSCLPSCSYFMTKLSSPIALRVYTANTSIPASPLCPLESSLPVSKSCCKFS